MAEFRASGIKAVKMDDIANKLAISKRTLYEIYANKEALLLECVRQHEEQMDSHLRDFNENKSCNVIDTIIEFYNTQIKNTLNVSPIFFDELHKYPSVLEYLDRKHMERMENGNKFMKLGIDAGLFRKDIDYKIISHIAHASMEYVMRQQLYKEYTFEHIIHNVTLLYIRGICTEEGIRILDKALKLK